MVAPLSTNTAPTQPLPAPQTQPKVVTTTPKSPGAQCEGDVFERSPVKNSEPERKNNAPSYAMVRDGVKGAAFTRGLDGAGVGEMQRKLKQAGYSTNTDGRFTPQTELAVKKFQQDNQLPANGYVQSDTLKALDANVNGSAAQQKAYEKNVKDTAQELSGKKVPFASSQSGVKFNDKFWEKTSDGFRVKDGVKPSDAMKDYLANPSAYCLDCAMSSKMLTSAAAMRTVGAEKFDAAAAKHGGLDVSFGEYKGLHKGTQSMVREDPKASASTVPPKSEPMGMDSWVRNNEKPGDAVYFRNPQAFEGAKRAGWGGENAIALGMNDKGEQLYFAHGVRPDRSIVTEQEIVDKLKTVTPNNAGKVERMDEIYRPDFTKF